MSHVFFGVVCLLSCVWVFVEALQTPAPNHSRLRNAAKVAAAAMWLSFLAGGYWYVTYYKADKNLILSGPWPFAHHLVMETKEHLVFLLLLLASYLPIVTANNLADQPAARRMTLWTAGMAAVLALTMEGEGAVIALGVKAALLARGS